MINQYIDNPELINNLTPQQKTQLYQDIQKHITSLQSQQTKFETELQIKQQEQQQLFQELQQSTGLQTIQEIQDFITNEQSKLNQELQSILTQFQQIQ